MKIFISRIFKWWEMGIIKACLISLGILLGLNFYTYLVKLTLLWWVIFIVASIYFIARFILEKENK